MEFLCINPCPTCAPVIPGSKGVGPLNPGNPFLNLSSEAPDVDLFIGRRYTPGLPPLNSFFYAVGCVGFCMSSISQNDADDCAVRQNALCNAGDWPTTIPNPDWDPQNPNSPRLLHPPRELFPNQNQTCEYICPDGTVNSSTVATGTKFAFSTTQADSQAKTLACQRATLDSICFGPLSSDQICIGVSANISVSTFTSQTPISFDIIGGALPTGLMSSSNESTAFFTGTPTVGGVYNFTLQATNPSGHSVSKDFSISVLGLANSTALTQARKNGAYSAQLIDGASFAGIADYSVGSGMPAGLTVNATTGLISGTCTSDMGTYAFNATIKYFSNGVQVASCTRQLSIEVLDPAGVWANMTWAIYTSNIGAAVPSASASFNRCDFSGTTTGGCWFAGALGSLTYTGPAMTGRITFHINNNPTGDSRILQVGAVFPAINSVNVMPVGDNIFTFSVPVSVGLLIQFVGNSLLDSYFMASCGNDNGGYLLIEQTS